MPGRPLPQAGVHGGAVLPRRAQAAQALQQRCARRLAAQRRAQAVAPCGLLRGGDGLADGGIERGQRLAVEAGQGLLNGNTDPRGEAGVVAFLAGAQHRLQRRVAIADGRRRA